MRVDNVDRIAVPTHVPCTSFVSLVGTVLRVGTYSHFSSRLESFTLFRFSVWPASRYRTYSPACEVLRTLNTVRTEFVGDVAPSHERREGLAGEK